MEMFKEYESPEMEIILVEYNDVITNSIGDGGGGGGQDGGDDPFGSVGSDFFD